ncbi:MAG: putative membrane protein [Pseudomonadales bacterium]|jgi:putative membrane protein
MQLLKRIALIVVVVCSLLAAIVFSLTNSEVVKVDWLLLELSAPVSLWIVSSFVVGGIVGMLACAGLYLRSKKDVYSVQRKLAKAEKELIQLRASLTKD